MIWQLPQRVLKIAAPSWAEIFIERKVKEEITSSASFEAIGLRRLIVAIDAEKCG
jgi:hypothetical protein